MLTEVVLIQGKAVTLSTNGEQRTLRLNTTLYLNPSPANRYASRRLPTPVRWQPVRWTLTAVILTGFTHFTGRFGLQPNRIRRGNIENFKTLFSPVGVFAWGVFAWVFLRIAWGICLGVSADFCGFPLRLNGVEKWDVDMPSTPESQYPALSIQKRSETQLYAVSPLETSKPKRWVSLGL